jgi:Ca2+-binding RTX toxin-like protein
MSNIPTAAEITSLYLFGTKTPPQGDALASPNILKHAVGVLPAIDANQFMTSGPGRFANPSQSELISSFFNPSLLEYLNPTIDAGASMSAAQYAAATGGGLGYRVTQLFYRAPGESNNDVAERVYIYNTQDYAINADARFIVDADGTRRIENLRVILPPSDDFDFVGGPTSDLAALYLVPRVDPWHIGKTVQIDYSGDFNIGNYSRNEFLDHKSFINVALNPLVSGLQTLLSGLATQLFDAGVTKFVDGAGRAIVYGDANGGPEPYNVLNVSSIENFAPFHVRAFINYGVRYVGGSGDEHVFAASAKGDYLDGGAGADTLDGWDGDDVIFGGAGKDTLAGGAGKDKYNGGSEDDVVTFAEASNAVTLNLSSGGTAGDAQGDTYTSVENVIGSDYADNITGDSKKNKIEGGDDKDTIDGGGGADEIYGGSKAQQDDGYKDMLSGGSGYDSYYVGADDVVKDSDGSGRINFGGIWLKGPEKKKESCEDHKNGQDEENHPDGLKGKNGERYKLEGGTVTVKMSNGDKFTVESFKDGDFGWKFDEAKEEAEKFDHSKCFKDPIGLDLNGDGISYNPYWNSNTYIDYNGDGFAERTSWVSEDDGIIVVDLNSNGLIDSAAEIFATGPVFGLQALALLDSNNDGRVDASDTQFNLLKVWQDADGSGSVDEGEMLTLGEHGIVSITTAGAASVTETVDDGVTVLHSSVATLANGSSIAVAGVNFEFDAHLTEYVNGGPVSAAAEALPHLNGYGTVKDLDIAMTEDGVLLQKVATITSFTSADAWKLATAVEAVILRWHGTEGTAEGKRGAAVDSRHLEALERLVGVTFENSNVRGFNQSARTDAGSLLANSFDQYHGKVMARLLAQSELGQVLFPELGYFSEVSLEVAAGTSVSTVLQRMATFAPGEPMEKLAFWRSMAMLVEAVRDQFTEQGAAFATAVSSALATAGVSYNFEQLAYARQGLDGGDTIYGHIWDGASVQNNRGTAFNDLIISGKGDDLIIDRGGHNTLVFATGHGNDELELVGGTTWTVKLEGLLASDISVSFDIKLRQAIVTITGTGEKITFANALVGGGVVPVELVFSDGNILTLGQGAAAPSSAGTGGDDQILGSELGEVLDGGAGNDVIDGGGGNDTYVLRAGGGQDSIRDSGYSYGTTQSDSVRIEANFADVEIVIPTSGPLVIRLSDGSSFTLLDSNRYGSDIESFVFNDVTVDHQGLVASALFQKKPVSGTSGDDNISGTAENEVLLGRDGNDTYHFGLGSGQDIVTDSGGYRDIDKVRIHAKFEDVQITFGSYGVSSFTLADGSVLTLANGNGFYPSIEVFQFDNTSLTYDELTDIRYIPGTPITGTSGADVITGSASNDVFLGREGSDTYQFGPGSGSDTILESTDTNATLRINANLAECVIVFDREDNLLLTLNDGSRLKIGNRTYLYSTDTSAKAVSTFVFNDQTLNLSAVEQLADIATRTVLGTAGDDNIAVSDNVRSNRENNIIIGGAGNDTLDGGDDGDTYIYQAGDGNDSILDTGDSSTTNGIQDELDSLVIRGHSESDVTLTRVIDANDDLILTFASTGQTITIRNQLENAPAPGLGEFPEPGVFTSSTRFNVPEIERILFEDTGTVWNVQDMRQRVLELHNAAAGETIVGFNNSDDVITGGAGNDTISGLGGSDTFVYRYGDGNDIINESRSDAGIDTLRLTGISRADVNITRSGANAMVTFAPSLSDSVVLQGQFGSGGSSNVIERIVFDDGTTLTAADISDIAFRNLATSGNDTITGTNASEKLFLSAGTDSLSGGFGDDIYVRDGGIGGTTTINENGSTSSASMDVLRLSGLLPSDVVVTVSGTFDLLFTLPDGTVKIAGQRATSTADVIERVVFDDGTVWDTADIAAQYITVSGATATLASTAGNDSIVGTAADETLDGGLGNDNLSGGAGSDLYVFGRGVGNDRITENGNDARFAIDRVSMQGVNSSDVTLSRISAEEIQIRINDTGETLVLNQQFQASSKGVEYITFADGVVWDRSFIAGNAFWRGTDLADSLVGQANYPNVFLGGKGNDTLDDGAFATAPVFVFNPGDGVDKIISYSPTKADGVVVIHGVSANDISLEVVNLDGRSGLNDLRIRYSATDSIIVSRQFYNADSSPSTGFGISEIRLDDSTVLDLQDILAAKTIGTSAIDVIEGRSVSDTIDGGAGNDFLSGNRGSDTYVWRPGSGNDNINDGGSTYDSDTLLIENADVSDFIISRSPGDSSELWLTYVPSGEVITLENQVEGYTSRSIETIRFADGTVWDRTYLAQNFTIRGTTGIDAIVGNYDRNSTIEGLAGDDQIRGNASNHTLIWSVGDGNDTFDLVVVQGGGGETESLVTSFSNQTTLQGTAGINVLKLHTVLPTDVVLSRSALAPLDLAVTVLSTGEVLTFTNFFLPVNGSLSRIEFDDATVLDVVALTRDMPITGSADADWITDSPNGDYIDGREGDDHVDAGQGLDVILWRTGDGNDQINLSGTQADADTLKLVDSLQGDVTFSRGTDQNFGSDALIITHNVTGEVVAIPGQFSLAQTPDAWQAIGRVVFADGSTLSAAEIAQDLSAAANVIFGSSGDDVLSGTSASETLAGGQGDDTYLFGRGAAEDTVVDSGGNNDAISFAADVTSESLNLQRIGNDLLIEVGGEDRLTLSLVGQFDVSGSQTIENLSFANGLTLDLDAMKRLLLAQVQTGGNDVILGFDTDDVIFARAGNDLINGAGGNDYIDGGAGVDVVSFNGTQDEFTVTQTAGETIVTRNWTGEVTTLVNVEEIRFVENTPVILTENLAPIVSGFERALQEDTRSTILAVDLLATAVDPEGATLHLVSVESGPGGIVSLDAFGNVTFVPNPEFSGTAAFSYTISDGVFNVTATATLTINSVNDTPVVVAELERVVVAEDSIISFALPPGTFTDVDTAVLALTAGLEGGGPLPSWLNFDAASQTFSGQPPLNFSGALRIVVVANDGNSTVLTGFDFVVEEINDAPVATGTLPNVTATEGLALSVALPMGLFVDADGAITGYFASLAEGGALPSWLSFDQGTGALHGTPPNGSAGALELTIYASDGRDVASVPLKIEIAPSNQAPEVAQPLADLTFAEDAIFNFALPVGSFTDSNGDTLSYTATLANGTALPSWLVFNSASQTFTGTPPSDFNGQLDVKVTASDGSLSVADTFTLTVSPVNDAPIVANLLVDQSSAEDTAVNFVLPSTAFSDVDGDSLSYAATLANGSQLPSWLNFNAATGAFSGAPPANFNGDLDVRVTASDGALSASDVFSLTITPVNDAPVVAVLLADRASPEDNSISFSLPANSFSDVDGDTLAYSATLSSGSALPVWLSFNPTTQTFTGTPPQDFNGVIDVKVTASDGSLSASDVFSLTITSVNDAPVIVTLLADRASDEDTALSFVVPANAFTDVDGDMLTYSAKMSNGAALPAWLSFNSATLAFTGTPPANFYGSFDVKVAASDGSLTASDIFTLNIMPVNDAPVVAQALADISSPEDSAISFALPANAFTDVDNSALIYSATLASGADLPAWLNFNAATQSFSGTPPLNFNGALDVKVTASDGVLSASDVFALTITPVNDAPIVAALLPDKSSAEDTAFNFTIPAGSFRDVDNATLTYSATLASGAVLPAWLVFNGSSQTFSGTPPLNYNGSIDVKVTASDGVLSASDVFALVITPVNDNPLAVNDTGLTTAFNTALTILPATLLANDSDVDGDTLTIGAVSGVVNGTVALTSNGSVVFTPTAGYSGAASFSYTVSDGRGGTATATVSLTVQAGQSGNVINGTANADLLFGTAGVDIINGLAGNDIITAGAGNDTVNGGAGNDIIDGGTGADTLNGGTGNDIYVVDNAADVVNELLNEGTDLVTSTISWTLGANLENLSLLSLTTAALNGTGNALNNAITGTLGDNILDGGLGADTLIGASGNDTYIVDNAGDVITELAGEGTDSVQSSINWTLGANLENLTLTGSATINGTGNSGSNIITGNAAANTLSGGAGNDQLTGAAGNDSLSGGLGNDTFNFAPGFGKDTVTDFSAGIGVTDVLRLTLGTAFDSYAEVMAVATQVGANTVINISANDSITLNGILKTALVADDFLFV